MDGTNGAHETGGTGGTGGMRVELAVLPERRLIPRGEGTSHVALRVRVAETEREPTAPIERASLALALVLDRSGSMSGEKIRTARRAAQALLGRLDERDTAAVVIFDDLVETLVPATRMTAEAKAAAMAALRRIQARATTALHEGWLTGCHAIASDEPDAARLSRCFLLTDGLANVGLTDPEQIASQAAGIRESAGIATSTFGIGDDYAEELLGPMAEAGGGRFYHLRTAAEIATTLVGELGELLATAAANVRIELEVEPGIGVTPVSTHWMRPDAASQTRWTITLGDLLGGEERHAVVRLTFADQPAREEQVARARVLWTERGAERATNWQALRFTYASAEACAAEPADPEVARLAARHLSDRSQREALRASKLGDHAMAFGTLRAAKANIASLAPDDALAIAEVSDIDELEQMLAFGPLAPAYSKERYFQSQRRSGGYRDKRQPDDADDDADDDASE